jgi:hypothetical protein
MLDANHKTLHPHPSLLPLRMALIAAESEVPSRPSHSDVNEQLAVQLIEKMKTAYKKPLTVLSWQDIPSPHGYSERVQEMAIADA